ncbi:MAG: hypothetical protein H6699_03045 [Myxococcales bacterium]|nr:hypothetical protein [Myxococcales bacterium]
MSETAYLCFGKDCRKHLSDTEKLQSLLEGHGLKCTRVSCQKLCSGPVVGLTVDGTLEWFAKVRKEKGRQALLRFLTRGDGPLRKRRKKKRSGKLRIQVRKASAEE